ncbi:MAG TPA: DEAD/DEAH box helicase [Methanosarcinaceae archaeon]|nr:DEAD/DEAH box helicase [Methanosarcinaceae archaeon]
MTTCIKHSLIRPGTVEQRLYQLNLAGTALSASSLVVLPTGLGKTIIALLVIVSRLEKIGGKVLVLSPTKPLVEQHASFFKNTLLLPEEEILTFTGSLLPAKRAEMWKTGKVIVSTPQVIENDLLTKRINLNDVSHITFDEAHRAVGNYAYTYIAEKYFEQAGNPLILGITASPGSDNEKIAEVCEALHVRSVAVKTETDSDVAPYVHEKEIEWKRVNLPAELGDLKYLLEKVLDDRFTKLSELGFTMQHNKNSSKRDLLALQKQLQSRLRGDPNPAIYGALSILAEILKVNHAVEVIETQGVEALSKYMERLDNEAYSKNGSKASKRLAGDLNIRQLVHSVKECTVEHPKMDKVREIVKEELDNNPNSRVIVFTNYRDTAEMVTNALSGIKGVRPIRFVGQASKYKDKGLNQKQQVEIIEKFKSGEYNTLVATSVAEEGLDIPATDLVLFYEPVPSEIRTIQRRGRTGRKHKGRVVILITKGTRDEAYYWSSNHKERKMQSNMRQLQEDMPVHDPVDGDHAKTGVPEKEDQKKLFEFDTDSGSLTVIIDQREMRSTVARTLDSLGVDVVFKTLEVGDYVLSDRLAVERKTVDDFASSLIDSRRNIFTQVSNLARTYDKPVLIIEGEGLFTARQLNPNAIHGTLASLSIDFGVSIFHTRDAEDTAALIRVIAKREQIDERREVSAHGKKSSLLLSEQQEYVISSISEIGPKAARSLLKHFGSVEAVMKAGYEDLLNVKNIGPKTAARIREVVESEYKA